MKAARRRLLPPVLALLLGSPLRSAAGADVLGDAPLTPPPAALPAGALEVTSVSSGSVTLDGALVVRGMTLVNRDGEAWVVMPASGGNGDAFADVRLRSRALHDRLAAALAGGAVRARRPRRPSFAVERVGGLKSPRRLANVRVVFDGEIEAVFGVLARPDGSLAVLPPAAKGEAGWEPLLEIREPALKAAVEAAVLAAFRERR